MRLIEYRIILPFAIDYYPLADTYMYTRRMEIGASEGENVELLNDKIYDDEEGTVYYSSHVYHCYNRIPSAMKWLVPKSLSDFREESWTSYPRCWSRFIVDFLGDSFKVDIKTRQHEFINLETINSNPCDLTDDELNIREIRYIDILQTDPKPEREEWNLDGFSFEEAGIHTLHCYQTENYDFMKPPEWIKNYKGKMTLCAKVIKANISIWGFQTTAEKLVAENMAISIFLDSGRAQVALAEQWIHMSKDDINEIYMDVARKVMNIAHEKEINDMKKKSWISGY
ncbi:Phosphatidylinositol transfer protein [Tritrichomonas foetus]|uniref:Phosphatidylinositol transfer protein n=1 Tax=Tritrichomonas foetus TaxID=1144522 RepID=A0A1J4KII0_9EUKA|nr:Phosphatidylinositol transfer protein [Tritrichomonas foetus]|eukprot:OHT09636.1 Phosphatidylinositol transfer protein [Tritrichomonas foetus]